MEETVEYGTKGPDGASREAEAATGAEENGRLRALLRAIGAQAEEAARPCRYKTSETLRGSLLDIAARCAAGTGAK